MKAGDDCEKDACKGKDQLKKRAFGPFLECAECSDNVFLKSNGERAKKWTRTRNIVRHPPPNPAQGETLAKIIRHARLMRKAGAPAKRTAEVTAMKCREALSKI